MATANVAIITPWNRSQTRVNGYEVIYVPATHMHPRAHAWQVLFPRAASLFNYMSFACQHLRGLTNALHRWLTGAHLVSLLSAS